MQDERLFELRHTCDEGISLPIDISSLNEKVILFSQKYE